jgi:hypothetical protein
MKSEGSLPCIQEHITGQCLAPDQIMTSSALPSIKYETLAVHCDIRNTLKTLLQNAVFPNVTAAGIYIYHSSLSGYP